MRDLDVAVPSRPSARSAAELQNGLFDAGNTTRANVGRSSQPRHETRDVGALAKRVPTNTTRLEVVKEDPPNGLFDDTVEQATHPASKSYSNLAASMASFFCKSLV